VEDDSTEDWDFCMIAEVTPATAARETAPTAIKTEAFGFIAKQSIARELQQMATGKPAMKPDNPQAERATFCTALST
jgi:hypothetical protein